MSDRIDTGKAPAQLPKGMPVLFSGGVTTVPDEVAERYQPGDRVVVLQSTGDVLLIPQAQHALVDEAVRRAYAAFQALGNVPDTAIDRFYDEFAARLADDDTWAPIAEANRADVDRARIRRRSTTRLVADEKMRRGMIQGLQEWRNTPSLRDRVVETITHPGWKVEQVLSGLGVVGFVFEGRPNVFADATGVLRSGNTTVMRIGSDALGTAQAIVRHALQPALAAAGLPEGSIVLVESAEHAAGWALFSHPKLGLGVARGSGRAVEQLGSIARQAGIPVSLHGTGGAWIVADETADAEKFRLAIYHSLDRKVCNTVNTICVPEARAVDLVPVVLAALQARGEQLGYAYKLHVAEGSERFVPQELFHTRAPMLRAQGIVEETLAEPLAGDRLGHEWEWEQTPEVTLRVVRDVAEAVALFNDQSPQFVASLIAERPEAHDRFFRAINAPFVGNGFTRWVDGQYALHRPELGLSSWQFGRLFGRGGILTGDGVYTIRLRVTQSDPDVHR
ncbi:MAG: aldehyde dehydrogenase family protein [Armatimonadetes bacterium]|nr:aldehyde dehydrogenase family protein [Armatimonadota bacterium]